MDPDGLVERLATPPGLDRPVLVHALDGFVDAGAAVRLARAHLLSSPERVVVARFDVDQLIDYRSRRPPMVFVQDHWESYAEPRLDLSAVQDEDGVPYLVLSGPEPDVQWERFIAAVAGLVEALDVRLTIGLEAIPMGVPHTRPAGVTAHASRPELVAGHEPWVATVQVPGAATNLLEYRLAQRGCDAMGFAAHVPHYLAQLEYPAAAAALVEALARAGGLRLNTGPLLEAAARTRAEVDAQIADSAEIMAVVSALETQYDAYVGGRERGDLLAGGEQRLPTAEELGAELERFLADQARRKDDRES